MYPFALYLVLKLDLWACDLRASDAVQLHVLTSLEDVCGNTGYSHNAESTVLSYINGGHRVVLVVHSGFTVPSIT
jgi:hypothetical protein